MRWRYHSNDQEDKAKVLAGHLGVKEDFPMPLSRLLVERGVDDLEKAKLYFKPERSFLHDPLLMKGAAMAIKRMVKAVLEGEKILVYGDYDVDGTTSVTFTSQVFSDWGIETEYYIPDRYSEGYGLSYKGIDYAHKVGSTLMIILDCGTKAVDKVNYANTKGIDTIICDHHTPGPILPASVALINPKQKDCPYPFKDLSAAGVIFKLMCGFVEELKQVPGFEDKNQDYDLFARYCDLITLSIACDIVPMIGENRIIAHFGLEKIKNNPLPGIRALMNMSQVNRSWDTSDLVFFLGPRINSAGRLGDAKRAVKLLSGSLDEMKFFAQVLDTSNEERRELDAQITAQALSMIAESQEEMKRNSTVLFDDDWHKGVIGIVASRLIENHYKPTVLLTKSNGHWIGSGRSVHDFDLYEALDACSDHIVQFGGHKYAAGLTVKDEELENFKNKFEEVVSEKITKDQKEAILDIAAQIDFSYLNPKFIRLIKRFGPFGPGNMEPVFVAERVTVTNFRILKEKHLRLNLSQNGYFFEAIGFGLAEKWAKVNQEVIDIAFQPDFKTWNDKTFIQLNLKDLRPSN